MDERRYARRDAYDDSGADYRPRRSEPHRERYDYPPAPRGAEHRASRGQRDYPRPQPAPYRGGGLAGDYYDEHPLRPSQGERRYHDDEPRSSRPSRNPNARPSRRSPSPPRPYRERARSLEPPRRYGRSPERRQRNDYGEVRRPRTQSPSKRRSNGRAGEGGKKSGAGGVMGALNSKWGKMAQAVITAGAAEAFRVRNQPGEWLGGKGARVATVALGAAALGGASRRRK